jgi:cytochrome c6
MISKMGIDKRGFEKLVRLSSVLATLAVAALAVGFSGKAFAGDTIKGRQIYNVNCMNCHGATGRSVMPGAPNLDRNDALLRPDMTLLASIRSGKNAMPAFQGILSDRDIMDVIAYVRTLN